MKRLVIGTRGSALALWQARHVAAELQARQPGLQVDLEVIKTQGDKILDVPLAKVGGKGLFVKEIEEALLQRHIDLAVHSIKDVPSEQPVGLGLTAITRRADPRDALVSTRGPLSQLPAGARVGTSSLRRECQLRDLRPDLAVVALRGNVDTRLRKLQQGEFDAMILAAAGLTRLGYADRITEYLDPPWIPAAGQGALGIETRVDDVRVNAAVRALDDEPTSRCVRAERALLHRLEGGCQVPIGAHATIGGARLDLVAMVGHPSGTPMYRSRGQGDAAAPEQIGRELADNLLQMGARAVLQQLNMIQPGT